MRLAKSLAVGLRENSDKGWLSILAKSGTSALREGRSLEEEGYEIKSS